MGLLANDKVIFVLGLLYLLCVLGYLGFTGSISISVLKQSSLVRKLLGFLGVIFIISVAYLCTKESFNLGTMQEKVRSGAILGTILLPIIFFMGIPVYMAKFDEDRKFRIRFILGALCLFLSIAILVAAKKLGHDILAIFN